MDAAQPMVDGSGEAGHAACLNCGAPLTGPHCAQCGQKARLRRSLGAFVGDMLAGAFNFEGKFWRTLPLLLWRPGDLTRRYIEGQRACFISPPALYLFCVFLMFAVLSFVGTTDTAGLGSGRDQAVATQKATIARLDAERRAALAQGRDVATLDRRLEEERGELALLESIGEGRVVKVGGRDADQLPPFLREPLLRASRDPERAASSVLEASSKYSWLLIPLSLPFMWLLFPFSRRLRMFDHAVFVTYSVSFMMLLVIAGSLLTMAGMTGTAALLVFIPPVHLYRQLRGAYRLGRVGALLRTVALLILCLVSITLWLMAMIAIGLA